MIAESGVSGKQWRRIKACAGKLLNVPEHLAEVKAGTLQNGRGIWLQL
jgi:hypothetical protein